MFKTVVVGTDGSETATDAVRQAVEHARELEATLALVSAYEPVPAQRLREERRDAPEDMQWAINPREDVDATLETAAQVARDAGVTVDLYARQGDPAVARALAGRIVSRAVRTRGEPSQAWRGLVAGLGSLRSYG